MITSAIFVLNAFVIGLLVGYLIGKGKPFVDNNHPKVHYKIRERGN